MVTLQELIGQIRNLKPIPAVAHQLLSVVDDPDSAMADIANVIQYDPVITASVLKTCNSAFFGLKQPAESIKDAAAMLGTDQIVELALVKSGAQVLSGSQKGYGLAKGDMWRYSVCSAVIARQIAKDKKLDNKNTIFTSALLKDLGKVLLAKYVEEFSDKIYGLVEKEGYSFSEAEKKILGIDHAELGAVIAKMWKFSPRMINIIRHHHLADEKMVGDLDISTVYLSDCICMMTGTGVGADGLSYRFKGRAMKALGITPDELELIIAEFAVNMKDIEALLNAS